MSPFGVLSVDAFQLRHQVTSPTTGNYQAGLVQPCLHAEIVLLYLLILLEVLLGWLGQSKHPDTLCWAYFQILHVSVIVNS